MDIETILNRLRTAEDVPADAIEAAEQHRGALTPRLVAAIERWLAAAPEERAAPSALFRGLHILGAWGAAAAYRPMARLLRAPAAELEALLGDAATETMPRLMAMVCDGDPEPIYDIIRDPAADEGVRAGMFDVVTTLAVEGTLDRAAVARFLAEAAGTLQPQAANFVWVGWQGAVAALGLDALRGQVREMFARGYIDEIWISVDDFESALDQALADPQAVGPGRFGLLEPFVDVVAELEDWQDEQDADWHDGEEGPDSAVYEALGAMRDQGPDRSGRFAGSAPQPGPNDPCSCGSGKMYKDCCGR